MQVNPHTEISTIAGRVQSTRHAFRAGVTRPIEWRRAQLQGMIAMLTEHEQEFLDALRHDLGKPTAEAFITDVAFVTGEIKAMIKNLRKWNTSVRVSSPLVTMPAKSCLMPEPLGVVLVIAPWNYPVQLLLVPAAGAIAAGNAVVLKPSEVSSAVSTLLAKLVPQYLDSEAVAIIEGGVAETTELLAQQYDHIFYTGNGTVGRVVMTAAAKNLTPVTLELGGKSPVIVDASANLRVTARRIAWGKWLNAGQTCVAPDYVLVHESVHDKLIVELQSVITDFYGTEPHESQSYARIVSPRHFDRLKTFLNGATAAVGGDSIEEDRYISPTVLINVDPASQVMHEEIFGPILPIIPITSINEAIDFVTSRPHPLALYVFAENKKAIADVLERTTAGGVTVNGTIMHLTNPGLPFGGVGESGMGGYHGKAGVRVFQHLKPVLSRGTMLDPSIAYPPYTTRKLKLFRKVL
ncbi:MAG: aldehyde dehydrogenase family protein [Ilumatobacteraceae bacterium]|nr:aldehyde dehydrogenase family protein [Ilumatobacteraceae bacterium]